MKDKRLEKMRRKKSECLEEKRECSGNLQAERLAGEKQKVWQQNLKETPSGNKPERREGNRHRERWRKGGEREREEEKSCTVAGPQYKTLPARCVVMVSRQKTPEDLSRQRALWGESICNSSWRV